MVLKHLKEMEKIVITIYIFISGGFMRMVWPVNILPVVNSSLNDFSLEEQILFLAWLMSKNPEILWTEAVNTFIYVAPVFHECCSNWWGMISRMQVSSGPSYYAHNGLFL